MTMIPTTLFIVRATSIAEADRSTTIKRASCILLSLTVAVFIARQVMKATVFRSVAIDDMFALLATLFAVGISITAFILASEGLGSPETLTFERAGILMKGYYASEIMYISGICFGKLSLLVVLYTIVEVQRAHRRIVFGFGVSILVWSCTSLLAIALQCSLPKPWEVMTLRCFNIRAFWTSYCIIDTATELCIILLSINLVAYLKVRLSQKIMVVACFAPRILVISAAITRLVWLYPITPHSNPEFRLWRPTIITQVQVCLSVCTACIPYMVPFFRFLEGSVRRSYSARSRDVLGKDHKRSESSLWFRRRQTSKMHDSWNSTVDQSLDYEFVPPASPHLATPWPMSPTMPPIVLTPPARSQSVRGLCISIPMEYIQRDSDAMSSRTASSYALSPSCASPQPLLPKSFVASRRPPSPPSKANTPNSRITTPLAVYDKSTPMSTPRTQNFSLFPSQQSRSRSPQLRNSIAAHSVPPIRAMRSQNVPSPSIATVHESTELSTIATNPDPSTNSARGSKSSPAPSSRSPPLMLMLPSLMPGNGQLRPQSVQDLNSPMGAAINNWFSSAAPSEEFQGTQAPPKSRQSRIQ